MNNKKIKKITITTRKEMDFDEWLRIYESQHDKKYPPKEKGNLQKSAE